MPKLELLDFQILRFYQALDSRSPKLPEGFRLINPYTGDQKELVNSTTATFYKKYYHDATPRRIILGSSPARRGTAVTGVPFEDAVHLQQETGITIGQYHINKPSANFLYDVIAELGGCDAFYKQYYMNFVCPLGIARVTAKGTEVNCNYYETKKLQAALYDFILQSLREQLAMGFDTSVCYCIGSGENYAFLSRVNQEHKFFRKIVPLEHPRYITQYNASRKDYFMNKYLHALTQD